MKNWIDEYAISLLWENELPLGEVKKEITNEITFLELCKQNQGIATRQSPEIFHMKNYKLTSPQLQRLQRPHPLPELPHTHQYEQQLHPQV